jgi:dihydroorotate dehydrogenase (NAD+) catalytic subunit
VDRSALSAGLGAEHEGVAATVGDLVVALTAARRERKPARWRDGGQKGLETGVLADLGELPVVQPGAAQALVVEFESQRVDQVQGTAGIGAQAYDIAGVGRDLRLIQDDVEQARISISMAETDPRLAADFCGMTFATPLVLLSGCVGFGEEYTRVQGFSNRDAGAVCLKGTTGGQRLGNAPHRIYETPAGMLNAIGLQNPGADKVVDEILPTLDFAETRFIANVSGSTVEEYIEVTRRFEDSPIDAIEINISCPNVKEGGVAFGNDPDMSARVVEACRGVTRKPLITKLSPNQTDIAENARRCIEAGSDAFAVINTLMGMAIDIESRTPYIGNNQGGLSGPAIKPIALLKVHQVYQVTREHGIPIIGQGGVTTPEDAIEFLLAGAAAVGVGTALFYDPLILPKINQGILDYLERHRLEHVSQLTGALQLNTQRAAQQCGC